VPVATEKLRVSEYLPLSLECWAGLEKKMWNGPKGATTSTVPYHHVEEK
jgi:hypothetical protein